MTMLFSNTTVNHKRTIERRIQLEQLYKENFYNGKCKYAQLCEESIRMKSHDNWIVNDWSARIGDNYDLTINGIPVRVLIIGKEGKSFSDRITKPSRWWPDINRHYKSTYRLLKDIFSYYPASDADDIVLTMFAQSNTYSCAYRKYKDQTTGIKNTDIQKKSCCEIRKREIKILEPTVIVIQYDNLRANDLFADAINCCGKVYYSANAKCYIIESSHPSCRRHPWKKELDNSIDYLKRKGIIPNVSIS